MGWDTGFVKLGLHTVRGVLRTVGGRVPKQRYKELVAGVVAGVLAEHPDLDPAEARRRAEKATGSRAARDLYTPEKSPAAAPVKAAPAGKRATTRRHRSRPPAPAGPRTIAARRSIRKPGAARRRSARKVSGR